MHFSLISNGVCFVNTRCVLRDGFVQRAMANSCWKEYSVQWQVVVWANQELLPSSFIL